LALVRVAVLASGAGTILASLLAQGIEPELVVADRVAPALKHAAARGVATALLERSRWGRGPRFDRVGFSVSLGALLEDAGIELVVLAGFMTILAHPFVERFAGRIVNTHPSLLPSFPGHDAVRQALAAGVRVTGTTVHLVVEEVDAGPILEQEPVRVAWDDDVGSLHERIKRVERELYPRVVRALVRVGVEEPLWWTSPRIRNAIDEEVGPWRGR